MVYEGIASNGVHPLSEGVTLGVVGKVQIYLDEGLLKEIVCSVLVVEALLKEVEDSLVIAHEKVLEGTVVALGSQLYKLGI